MRSSYRELVRPSEFPTELWSDTQLRASAADQLGSEMDKCLCSLLRFRRVPLLLSTLFGTNTSVSSV